MKPYKPEPYESAKGLSAKEEDQKDYSNKQQKEGKHNECMSNWAEHATHNIYTSIYQNILIIGSLQKDSGI